MKKRIVFVKPRDLVPASIGLRSLHKLKSAHGGVYMGVHYDQSQYYTVLGTSASPVSAPKGIIVNKDPKGA